MRGCQHNLQEQNKRRTSQIKHFMKTGLKLEEEAALLQFKPRPPLHLVNTLKGHMWGR